MSFFMSLTIAEVSARTGLSEDAVRELKAAIARGGGRAAQFDHPDLGGVGQWQSGGLVMVGDMFNTGLAGRVALACSLLAEAHEAVAVPPAAHWWPVELGTPGQSAAQDGIEYACFPQIRRLAVRRASGVAVYDTGDLVVHGLAAQDGALFVTTDRGRRQLEALRRV